MNKNTLIKYRLGKSWGFQGLVILLVILSVLPLFAILTYIIKEGFTRINWQFLTQLPKPVGESGGGIINALIGSLIIVGIAAIMAIPFGVLCGIYLSENKTSKLAYWSRLATDILQGVPSIVIGIVVYFWVVKPMKSFSAFSGSVALGIMMLPIVIRATEETLKLLPSTLKEAAYALGMPYHRVILKVILPCGISGIISGVMLSIARIAGETAPLLFTAFGNPYLTADITKPMQSLPLLIFNYATSPYDDWHNLAWGASVILLIWILLLNLITKLLTRKWNIQF
jgi:phosphate transport system permease protein